MKGFTQVVDENKNWHPSQYYNFFYIFKPLKWDRSRENIDFLNFLSNNLNKKV